MTLDLEAIKARAGAAAPGEWYLINPNEGENHAPLWQVVNDDYLMPNEEGWSVSFILEDGHKADAEFIAHAREDIPALVAEVERLRAALEEIDDMIVGGLGL